MGFNHPQAGVISVNNPIGLRLGRPSSQMPIWASARQPPHLLFHIVDVEEKPWLQEVSEGNDAHEQFQRYCDSMAGSAVWGGQAELGALAHVLARRIDVFSVGMPTVAMGEEYAGGRAVPLLLRSLLALFVLQVDLCSARRASSLPWYKQTKCIS